MSLNRTVALVGASADAAKLASRPQRVLRKHGFTGTIVPINPGRSEINGDKAYPDIKSVPQKIDHAFIMVPAKAVPGVIDDCAAAGVKAATIFSAGFAETGEEGRLIQQRMVEMRQERPQRRGEVLRQLEEILESPAQGTRVFPRNPGLVTSSTTILPSSSTKN